MGDESCSEGSNPSFSAKMTLILEQEERGGHDTSSGGSKPSGSAKSSALDISLGTCIIKKS